MLSMIDFAQIIQESLVAPYNSETAVEFYDRARAVSSRRDKFRKAVDRAEVEHYYIQPEEFCVFDFYSFNPYFVNRNVFSAPGSIFKGYSSNIQDSSSKINSFTPIVFSINESEKQKAAEEALILTVALDFLPKYLAMPVRDAIMDVPNNYSGYINKFLKTSLLYENASKIIKSKPSKYLRIMPLLSPKELGKMAAGLDINEIFMSSFRQMLLEKIIDY